MASKLTPKQEKYVQGLFKGMRQREAYKQAYNCSRMTDKSVDELACRLAADNKIKSRLQELQGKLRDRNMVTVEKVLEELAKVAFANGSDFAKVVEKKYIEEIKDDDGNVVDTKEVAYKVVEVMETDKLDDDKLAAIAGIKETREGIEVKTNDKVRALELMGRALGMFVDKVEQKNTNVNIEMPKEAIEAELERLGFKKS